MVPQVCQLLETEIKQHYISSFVGSLHTPELIIFCIGGTEWYLLDVFKWQIKTSYTSTLRHVACGMRYET